ncbi:MAG: hypothetical protein IT366_09155 [Candidatus Hydrogenedentes bacterium]|nr:hypothetical protein [Candidatus Hydrogenedentota bacterium]
MRVISPLHTLTFLHHKATRQGYVVMDGRYFYLRSYDSLESRTRYHQILAEWIVNVRTLNPPRCGLTVAELILANWKFVETYYSRSDQKPSSAVYSQKSARRPLRDIHGRTPKGQIDKLLFRSQGAAGRLSLKSLGFIQRRVRSSQD